MVRSRFPSFWRKHAFENNPENSVETFRGHHPKFLHFWRIHDRLNYGEQNLDDQFGWNIFAHHAPPLSLNEQFSEVALDQCGPAALNDFEHLRRFLSHVAHEGRLDLLQ